MFSHDDKCIAAGTALQEQSVVSNIWYESRLPLTANMQSVKARDLHIQSESIRWFRCENKSFTMNM